MKRSLRRKTTIISSPSLTPLQVIAKQLTVRTLPQEPPGSSQGGARGPLPFGTVGVGAHGGLRGSVGAGDGFGARCRLNWPDHVLPIGGLVPF